MSQEGESCHAFPISLLTLANADCALAELLIKEPMHTLEALRCFQSRITHRPAILTSCFVVSIKEYRGRPDEVAISS